MRWRAGYLTFGIGDTVGAIAVTRVREVLPMADLVRAPGGPPTLAGFLNLGGSLTPVLRLDRVLGIDGADATASNHLILLKITNVAVAVMVDRALDFVRVDDAAVLNAQAPGAAATTHLRLGEAVVHVLDVETLVTALGRGAFDEAQRAARAFVGGRAGDAA